MKYGGIPVAYSFPVLSKTVIFLLYAVPLKYVSLEQEGIGSQERKRGGITSLKSMFSAATVPATQILHLPMIPWVYCMHPLCFLFLYS